MELRASANASKAELIASPIQPNQPPSSSPLASASRFSRSASASALRFCVSA